MIALRTLQNLGTGADVVLFIDFPKEDAGDWRCEYRVQGLRDQTSDVQFAMGIDGWQALSNALTGMRLTLCKSYDELRMFGHAYEGFFPRWEPMQLGREFLAHIQKLIDEQMRRVDQEAGFLASVVNAKDEAMADTD